MGSRFSELRCKEVVNTADGCRLGFVSDVIVDTKEGKLVAIIVPGPGKMLGLLGRSQELVIPWHSIKRIGSDIILVDFDPERKKEPRQSKLPF